MKKLFTLISALLLTASLSAQIQNGSIAPDFTVTDINGNSHNLYTYLNQGQTVILDLSRAWCGDCFFYHSNGLLEQIYQDRGPQGDNSIQVLMVEVEELNTIAQINGVSTGQTRADFSQGNWTDGISYPIIDDASVGDLYNVGVGSAPDIFVIRPNRRVYNAWDFVMLQNLIAGNIGFFQAYIEYLALNSQMNDVAILSQSAFIFRDGCSEVNEVIPVTNLGTQNVTSIDGIIVDAQTGEPITNTQWTGDIAPFETALVTFPPFTFDGDEIFADVAVGNPNMLVDSINFLNVIDSIRYRLQTSTETCTFNIRTDFWPEEIEWFFLNQEGDIVLSHQDVGPLSCDVEYQQIFEIESDDCYTFRITDSFGDGVVSGQVDPNLHDCNTPNGQVSIAMGYVALVNSEGDTLFSNNNYGAGTDILFEGKSATSIQEVEAIGSVNVFPNPVSDKLNINFDLENTVDLEISVYDNLGKLVHRFPNTSYGAFLHQLDLDVTSMAKGMYTITFTDRKGINTKRFSVQ